MNRSPRFSVRGGSGSQPFPSVLTQPH